ncbi:glycoside hydrolase family 2 protein [Desmospora activa]|uniref:Beta-glucuronidase n=1 Tax=Desmospora activa DSM 45169 TaxID=1121389 RepID=A0A2T4ZCA8_9BACL|nr:glycoside hydrolase family 2 TIM barrel-domain containing protein [Desmospora activa]PTM59512.1 beta-glucuronidase [Desmospora activa DSM 45169]
MIRLYCKHRVRAVTELEGMWDFAPVEGHPAIPDCYDYRLPVPGCWESHPELNTYRGRGWYRKEIQLEQQTPIRLEFKGVSHTADVYWDGHHIAHHYNAYTPFYVVVPDVSAGNHELTVLVDNRFTPESALHIPNDYYTYGGLIRPVALERIADVFIDRVHFTPFYQDGNWWADIETWITNLAAESKTITLQADLAGETCIAQTLHLAVQSTVKHQSTVCFPTVKPWSHQDPQLYYLSVQLYRAEEKHPLDDWIERVGFRQIEVADGQIRINGKAVTLKGFCRHEDHPLVGSSFPLQLMVQDLDLMEQMGANAVRTAHYPHDERFLDLCDERGIYVWEENHARGLDLERMRHPLFANQCKTCNREMVQHHYNHPSIIIWGVLNECSSDTEEGRVHYKTQLHQIRTMDRSRPVSFASDKHFTDRCLDLADILSFNIYPGWYIEDEPGDLSDRLYQWAEQNGGKGKPMIISEFGGDGFYGYRSLTKVKGTEERQAEIIGRCLQAFLSREAIAGVFIWQFCDCRVTEGEGWLLTRAKTMNSKGIVDEYRRPKLAYETVRRFFSPESHT